MRGHLRERSPGHWAIVIDVRDPQTAKRKRRWHSFAGTKRQAQVECARLLTETKNGTSVDPTRMTVAAFLERWIEHMEGQVSPRSHERYTEITRDQFDSRRLKRWQRLWRPFCSRRAVDWFR